MFEGPRLRLVCHRGTIVNFDKREGYYKVRYEDGNTAEHNEEQIKTMMHKPKHTNIIRALSATRHERVEVEYINTPTSFKVTSKFSNGYSKAIEMIEANQQVNQGLLFQGYKYANAVISKETGKAL